MSEGEIQAFMTILREVEKPYDDEKGEFENNENTFRKAVNFAVKNNLHEQAVVACDLLSSLYEESEKSSVEWRQKQLDHARKTNEPSLVCDSLMSYATALKDENMLKESVAILEEALAICTDSSGTEDSATVPPYDILRLLGQTYTTLADYSKALETFSSLDKLQTEFVLTLPATPWMNASSENPFIFHCLALEGRAALSSAQKDAATAQRLMQEVEEIVRQERAKRECDSVLVVVAASLLQDYWTAAPQSHEHNPEQYAAWMFDAMQQLEEAAMAQGSFP